METVVLFVFVNLLLALSNRIDFAIRIHIFFNANKCARGMGSPRIFSVNCPFLNGTQSTVVIVVGIQNGHIPNTKSI